MRPPYLTRFDSGSAPLRVLGRFLHGDDFPHLGMPAPMAWSAKLANRLPESLRERIYAWGGRAESIAPDRVNDISSEAVASWMVSQYPRRRYPAVLIGVIIRNKSQRFPSKEAGQIAANGPSSAVCSKKPEVSPCLQSPSFSSA